MKNRFGFVSNSSSSSFVVYGISGFDEAEIAEIAKTKLKELGEDISDYEDDSSEAIYDYFVEELGWSYNGEYSMLGRSWSSINDDETGAEFKKSVEDALVGKTCHLIDEVFYG
jgi:hypothetical protein